MIELSVEELAFTMGYLNNNEAAAGLMTATYGQLPRAELTGRITAASHSMIARGLLEIGESVAETTLNAALREMVTGLLNGERTLRCERRSGRNETLLTIQLDSTPFVTHQLRHGVVSQLGMLADRAALLARIGEFVGLKGNSAENTPIGTISAELLQTMRQQIGSESSAQIAERLSAELPTASANELATDLTAVATDWGSILPITVTEATGDQPPLEANSGLFYAVTPQNSWLFYIAPEDATQATIYRGSPQTLHQLLETEIIGKVE